jgi:hypothetical protein
MHTKTQRDELQRQRSFAYYDKNRIAINERVRLKRLNTRLSVDGIRPIAQANITKKEILTLIGIKALTLDKIVKDARYCMPKHTGTHMDGTVLYNRAEIMGWLPYIREVCAFMYKRPVIKLTGMSAQIVQFMHRSKDMELYCNEARRRMMDGRSKNGQGY